MKFARLGCAGEENDACRMSLLHMLTGRICSHNVFASHVQQPCLCLQNVFASHVHRTSLFA